MGEEACYRCSCCAHGERQINEQKTEMLRVSALLALLAVMAFYTMPESSHPEWTSRVDRSFVPAFVGVVVVLVALVLLRLSRSRNARAQDPPSADSPHDP